MLAIAQGSEAASAPGRLRRRWRTDRSFRRGLRRASSPGRASPSSATTSSSATSCRRRSRRCARRRADLRAGPRRADRAERASGCASRSTRARRSTARDFVFVCVGTPPTYSGDADLSRVWTVVDELPTSRAAPVARDEEHRARRHRREGARGARPARARRTSATSSNPEFTAEGRAVARLHGARPRSSIGAFDDAGRRRGRGGCYDGARRADRPHGRRTRPRWSSSPRTPS